MVVIAKVERIAPKNAASNRHTTHPGIICIITCVPIACPVAFTPSGSDRFPVSTIYFPASPIVMVISPKIPFTGADTRTARLISFSLLAAIADCTPICETDCAQSNARILFSANEKNTPGAPKKFNICS